jgi:hypothetical protein
MDTSSLHTLLNASLPVSMKIFHWEIMAHQILLTIDCLSVVLFVLACTFVILVGPLNYSESGVPLENFNRAAAYCFVALMSVLMIAAVNLLFLTFSLARLTSKSAGFSAWDVVNYYAWHIANMVPGLKLTSTLQWNTSLSFADPWSGWLLLMAKTVCILVAAIPIAKLLQVSRKNFRLRHHPVLGQLAVLADFDRAVDEMMSTIKRFKNLVEIMVR